MKQLNEFLGFGKTTYNVEGIGEFTKEDPLWIIHKDLSVTYPELLFYLDIYDKNKLLDEQVKVVKGTFNNIKSIISLLDKFPPKLYDVLIKDIINKKQLKSFIKEVPFPVFNRYVDILGIGLSSIRVGTFMTYWYTMFDDMMLSVPVKNWTPMFNDATPVGMSYFHVKIDKVLRGLDSGLIKLPVSSAKESGLSKTKFGIK